MVKSLWMESSPGFATDGEFTLIVKTALEKQWRAKDICPIDHEASDYFNFDYSLGGGEEVVIDLCFGTTAIPKSFNYDIEKANVISQWHEILSKMKIVPDTNLSRILSMYRHLAMQSLQMLAKYSGSDLVTPRQGDVGRYVWPWEAANMLIALDRIGLTSHTGDAYRYFIEKWYVKDGADEGKIMSNHQQWGNLNGALIWGISEHLMYTKNHEELEFFRPYLNKCLDWIQRERKKSETSGDQYTGIFPTGKGTDWGARSQHWCFTDGQNVMGIESMARMYEYFGIKESAYVKGIYEDYKSTLLGIIAELYDGHEDDDSYILPHQLSIPFEDTKQYCYYICGAPYLFHAGIIPYSDHKFKQMENYFIKHGMFDHGLTGRMTNSSDGDPGLYGDVFYTVNGEQIWLEAYHARGERKKAEIIMKAVLKYCVTSEYIVSERYCSFDPWYSPWQPNASSCGRMINILLNHYGVRRLDNETANN